MSSQVHFCFDSHFFQGSYHCGECLPGYVSDEDDECVPDRMCPDGSPNFCHEMADCIIHNRGIKVCEVIPPCSIYSLLGYSSVGSLSMSLLFLVQCL